MRSLLVIPLLAGLLLGACGYKGALYLPNKASAPATASTTKKSSAPATAPVPNKASAPATASEPK